MSERVHIEDTKSCQKQDIVDETALLSDFQEFMTLASTRVIAQSHYNGQSNRVNPKIITVCH